MKPEYIPYNGPIGGRVWIGQICIADVFDRTPKADLFTESIPSFEFHIPGWLKYQPEGEWLQRYEWDYSHYIQTFSSIEEGLDWIAQKLNKDEQKLL